MRFVKASVQSGNIVAVIYFAATSFMASHERICYKVNIGGRFDFLATMIEISTKALFISPFVTVI